MIAVAATMRKQGRGLYCREESEGGFMTYEDEILKEGVDFAREKLAAFMLAREYATGHGDTMDELLKTLGEEINNDVLFHAGCEAAWANMYKERIRVAVTKLTCLKDKTSSIDNPISLADIDNIIATLEGVKL